MGRGKWFTSHKETTFAHFPALREAAHGSCHIRQQNSHIFLPCVKWHTWITSHKATKFAHFSALWDVAHGSRLIWQPNSRTFRQATLSKEGCVCIHISKYVYMGWLRLVGSLKLQVSLAGYSRFYRTLLRKTYNFKENTNRSHPIPMTWIINICTYIYWWFMSWVWGGYD